MRKTCGKVPSTAAISGDITIGFTVRIADAATFANARVLPEDGGMIVDRTIRPPSSKAPDVAQRRVCAFTTSLAPFAIALIDVDRHDIRGAAIGTDDRHFQLRAEHAEHGRTLVYTIVYRATDRSGNTRDVAATVVVPPARRHHSQRHTHR